MENNTMKHGTAIAVIIAVIVVGFFLGGLVYQNESSSTSSAAPATTAATATTDTDGSSAATAQSASSVSNTSGTSTLSVSSPYPMTTTADGLQMQDITIGTGPAAKAGDVVSVNYIGTLTDGTKFDSSYDRGQPIQFTLGAGQVIPGWDEGLVGMQVGGKRELVIPSALAYGSQAYGPIPANSTLVFQVELMAINPPSSATTGTGSTQ